MSRIIEERTAKEREGLLKLFEVIRKSETANLGIVNYSNGKIQLRMVWMSHLTGS